LDFWRQYGHQSKWVGLHSPNVLVWRLPAELTGDEIQAGVKELEKNARQWTQLYEGSNPEFAHIKSHEGWTYILWSHVLREPDLRPSTSTQTAAQNLSFGPVMERTLIDSKNSFENEVERTNAMIMIDFDTGSLLSGSQAMWDADTDAQKRWMQTNGVDALCVVSGVGGLMGLDMKTVLVSSQAWDEVSTAMLNQLVESPRQETVSLTLPLRTAYALQNAKEAAAPTWLFQTREGATGVLQITGFTVNPRGVKIRYKLLQNGNGKN
jgi:hypothetical protein